MSDHLTLTLTPERPATLQGINTQVDVLLQIKAPDLKTDHERSPLNLSVVLDRSGSMNGDPLEVAKQSALFVQSRLTSRDVISLVTYDDTVDIVSPSSAARPNDHYQRGVREVQVGGTTNLFGGWEAGVQEVAKRAQNFDTNRVLLLSDGCLNHGVTDPDEIKTHCLEAAKRGIKTSTYGLGTHFDESVMCMMAEVSGGNNRYGERVEDLLEGFIEELDLLAHLYTSELTLTLKAAPGVEVTCLNNFIEREGELLLPDLAYGAEVWAGLRLKVNAKLVDPDKTLLTVQVKATNSHGAAESEMNLNPLPVLSPSVFEAVATSDVVTQYFAELKMSTLKLEATQAVQRRDWQRVETLIAQMKALPMTDAQRAELDELEQLFERRDIEVFSKEARFSVSQSQRSMKSDAASYLLSSNWVGSQQYDDEVAPSYLRKKSRQGRSSVSQKSSLASPKKNPFVSQNSSKKDS